MLLESLAKLFNNYFNPCIPVSPHHIVTGLDAKSCLDALLYKICDPEDGVLVPGPYWSEFPLPNPRPHIFISSHELSQWMNNIIEPS